MKLLQRNILIELVRVFSLLVVVLTVMLVFVGLLREASEHGLGPLQILQIMPFVVPSMLPFTIPATMLLAVTVVYGRMAGDLEVTAAKAAGINPLQLLTPAFLMGAVLTVASFGLTNNAIPWAISNIERIVTQAMEQIFMDVLSSQHYISRPDDGYSITVHDVQRGFLIEPTFTYRNVDHQQVTATAKAAKISFDLENRKARITLHKASFSVPGRDSGGQLDHQELEFDIKQELGDAKPRHMTIGMIDEKLREFEQLRISSRQQHDQQVAMLLMTGEFEQLTGDRVQEFDGTENHAIDRCRRYTTEIHTRFAMAGSCLFFAFVGGPFAILQARKQFITAFIMCFLPILLIYYPVMFLMINLCKTGTVAAWWSMWVPNVIITAVGAFVLRKVIRH